MHSFTSAILDWLSEDYYQAGQHSHTALVENPAGTKHVFNIFSRKCVVLVVLTQLSGFIYNQSKVIITGSVWAAFLPMAYHVKDKEGIRKDKQGQG